jgi:hypothetical protein
VPSDLRTGANALADRLLVAGGGGGGGGNGFGPAGGGKVRRARPRPRGRRRDFACLGDGHRSARLPMPLTPSHRTVMVADGV